jgi:transposase-like protein
MTVKKLTAADRAEILDLYRNTGETTSTLADRYGVSNSTISRFLKVTLPEDEYETLISAKRAARTPGGGEKEEATITSLSSANAAPVLEAPVLEAPVLKQTSETDAVALSSSVAAPTPKPVRKRRSTTKAQPEVEPLAEQLELLNSPATPVEEAVREEVGAEANTLAAMLVGEELLDEDDDDEDDDDLEDLEDLDEDDFEEDTTPVIRRRLPVESFVRVLPLSEAMLPRTCYIVIDRMAELITRPLRDFADLGQIPVQEVQQKTLPIFDNHRVARRFSSKRDRVIKVPDSRMLQKTRAHLQSKGITRLLFDGRVYSLSSS